MTRSRFEPILDAVVECTPRAPAEARRVLESVAREFEHGLLRDTQLVVSELVTNSVLHSGSTDPIRLRVWERSGGLRVEIADGGFGFDADSHAAAGFDADAHEENGSAEGGRGILILSALADRWGVGEGSRTRVWFELSPRDGRGSQAQAS